MKKIGQKLLAVSGLATDQFYGIVDYIIGVLLITLPWFFVNEYNMNALLFIMFCGIILIVYSMFTDYRYGLIRWISIRLNIFLDVSAGMGFIALGYPALATGYLGVTFVTTGILIIAFALLFEIAGKRISLMHGQEFAFS